MSLYMGALLLEILGEIISILLGDEPNGYAIDATTEGGNVVVKDVATPANDLDNVILDKSNLTQSGTSPKMVLWNSAPFVRWTPHNLALRSEEFDNAIWANNGSGTLTANQATAPDGTFTADLWAQGGGSGKLGALTPFFAIITSAVYTVSFYIKPLAISSGWIRIGADGSPSSSDVYTWLNASTGAIGSSSASQGSSSGAAIIGASSTAVGNGWYRVAITGVWTTADGAISPTVTATTTNGGSTRDSSATMYVWGAQMVRGYNALPYLATTSTARIGIPQEYDGYEDCFGILAEPAATNLVKHSEEFNASNEWDYSSLNPTISLNAGMAPDGSTTADKFTDSSSGNGNYGSYQLNLGGSTGNFTFSVYAKQDTTQYVNIRAGDDNSLSSPDRWVSAVYDLSNCAVTSHANGSVAISYVSSSITYIGDGWCRLTLTGTNSGASGSTWQFAGVNLAVSASPTFQNYGDIYFTGDGTHSAYFWGAQGEAGSVATSYIPTLGSTVTRAADKVGCLLSAIPFNTTKGTVYVDFTLRDTGGDGGNGGDINFHDGTTDNRIAIQWDAGDMRLFLRGNALTDGDMNVTMSVVDIRTQATGAWATNDCDFSVDGGSVVSDGAVGVPIGLTNFHFGTAQTGSGQAARRCHFYRLVYIPRQVQTEG